MKKIILSLFVFVVLITALCSCGSEEMSLSLKGYTDQFTVGDEFTTAGLTATITTKDGTSNVTDDVVIDSSMVDMSKPGVYAIIVTYENTSQAYYVTVNEVQNEQRLDSITVDTTSAKLSYLVGETFTSEGLKTIETYKNSNKSEDSVVYVTDLSDYSFVIRDKDDQTIDINSPLNTVGQLTVYVIKGNVRTNYQINVTKSAPSMDVAVSTVISNKDKVAFGTSVNDNDGSNQYYSFTTAQYEYGNDYLGVSYSYEGNTYHESYFIGKSGNPVALRVNETYVDVDPGDPSYDPNNNKLTILDASANQINGLEYGILYSSRIVYNSPEALLEGLYGYAKQNLNCDYTETIKATSTDTGDFVYTYGFNFGYLCEAQTGSVFYLFMFDVEFTIGQNNILGTLKVDQDCYSLTYGNQIQSNQFVITPRGEVTNYMFYENNDSRGFPTIDEGYTIDDCMARIRPGQVASSNYSCSYDITQTAGEQDAVNLYDEDYIYVKSYNIYNQDKSENLTLNTDTVELNTEIDVESDNRITLYLADFEAQSAFSLDTVRFYYKGVDHNNFYYDTEDLILYYNKENGELWIRCLRYGEYELTLKTHFTEKKIVINCDYRDPKMFTTQVFQDDPNPQLAAFVSMNTISCYVNDNVYFKALPDATGDSDFTATCSDSNAVLTKNPTANLPEALRNSNDIFYSFSANTAGVYVITLQSTRNNVKSTLTITVNPEPDFTEALNNKTYSFTAIHNDNGTTSNENATITFTLNSDEKPLAGVATISINDVTFDITFRYTNRVFDNVGAIGNSNVYNPKLSIDNSLNIVLSFSYNDGEYVVMNQVLQVI